MKKRDGVKTIRLLIVDDHREVIEPLAVWIFERAPDIDLVGMAHNGQMAVELARSLQPDVILMDLALPGLDGTEATRVITRENPGVRVLAFTGYACSDQVFRVIQAGAVGVYFKGQGSPDDLVEAIRCTIRGETVFPDELGNREWVMHRPRAQETRLASLTPTEVRLLDLTSKGYGTDKILSLLKIKEGTYRNYRRSIREKLGVTTWAQAVVSYLNLKP